MVPAPLTIDQYFIGGDVKTEYDFGPAVCPDFEGEENQDPDCNNANENDRRARYRHSANDRSDNNNAGSI